MPAGPCRAASANSTSSRWIRRGTSTPATTFLAARRSSRRRQEPTRAISLASRCASCRKRNSQMPPGDVAARTNGSVVGGVGVLLRFEGLALFLAATMMFSRVHGHWSTYAVLFLSPDLSLAAYLAGPKAGAIAYNTLHSSIGPLLLGLAAVS